MNSTPAPQRFTLPPRPAHAADPTGRLATEAAAAGLRARIWVACLGGAAVGAAGILWVWGLLEVRDAGYDPVLLAALPWGLVGLSLLVGALCAAWLDQGIVPRVRALSRAIARNDVNALRPVASDTGWGEFSTLGPQLQALLSLQERARRDLGALESTRRELDQVQVTLERWMRTAPDELLSPGDGMLATVAGVINQRLHHERDASVAGHEDLMAVRTEVLGAVEDARESAEQAERGFVEATAMLATARELQRLAQEMQFELDEHRASATADRGSGAALDAFRDSAAAAIEALIVATTASVEHLAAGLVRAQEIAEQVHLLSNRATMIALHAATTGALGADAETAAALRALAGDVQNLTAHTAGMADDVEREVAKAIERMRGVREHVAERLGAQPIADRPPHRSFDQAARLLERLREMVLDAAAKGERLAAVGERTSRAAERLVRRLEEDARRLDPIADADVDDARRARTDDRDPRDPHLGGRDS